jgi:hypothetical protein
MTMSEDRITTINPSWQLIDLPDSEDLAHQLVKSEGGRQTCECCYRDWIKKPRSKCLGLPMLPYARQVVDGTRLMSIEDGLRSNLRLRESTKPVAMWESAVIKPSDLLFARDSFIECEPNFYPIVAWDIKARPGLRTVWEINSKQLELKSGVEPAAVYFSDYYGSECRWRLLYAISDTQPKQPKYISKANLQAVYLISDGWLARIGEPDLMLENPHGRYYAPMKMYAISRIESFLSVHAQEYAEWLAGQGKRLDIARAVVAKSEAKSLKLKTQTRMCLKCASHSALLGGACCAIHPLGLPPGVPLDFYCPDFHARAVTQRSDKD